MVDKTRPKASALGYFYLKPMGFGGSRDAPMRAKLAVGQTDCTILTLDSRKSMCFKCAHAGKNGGWTNRLFAPSKKCIGKTTASSLLFAHKK